MKNLNVSFPEGEIPYKELKPTVDKVKFSIVVLFILVGVLYGLGSFDPFLENASIFFGVYISLLGLRLFQLQKITNAEDTKELTTAWYQANGLSIVTSIANSILYSMVIYYNELSHHSFYAVLTTIGTLVGGASLYYHSRKFHLHYSLANVSLPIITLIIKGGNGYGFALALILFFGYLRVIMKVQNTHFWNSMKNSNFLNLIIDTLPSPVSIVTTDLKYVKVNKTLASYYNEEPENFEGLMLGTHNGRTESQELISFLQEFKYAQNNETKEREISIEMRGKLKHFYFVATKIENSNHIACISLDLTELKTTQMELEQQKAMSIEAAKISNLGEMANAMAHEINNPLSIILGKSEQAIRVLEKETPDFSYLSKSLSIIAQNVKRIASIVQGLRMVSGQTNENQEDITLDMVIEKVQLITAEKLLANRIDFQVAEPPKINMLGNPSQLGQVILHLINNSVFAIDKQENPWIKIDFRESFDNVEIVFMDSGNGIPIEIAEKVFHPFFSTKELGKGMGLGLSVAKGVIDAHKGELFIDNNCKNTCFVIRLPKLINAAA